MSTTPSQQQRALRSVSVTSSGDRTVRARRSSNASADSPFSEQLETETLEETGSTDSGHDVDDVGGVDVHPAAWTASKNDVAIASRPPPLWRQKSDRGFMEDEDPEEGPSDYWRRPSPPLAPDLSSPAAQSPWLHTKPLAAEAPETPDGQTDGQVDAAEYSKRLEKVLALSHDTPSPSPTRRRAKHATGLWAQDNDGDSEGWGDYQVPNGGGYEEATRDILRGSERAGVGAERGEEEFGVLNDSGLRDDFSDRTPSMASVSISGQERFQGARASPSRPSRSYIHPSVSRLRSQPALVRNSSSSTQLSVASTAGQHARIPSHFSQISISRSDSVSTASGAGPSRPLVPQPPAQQSAVEEMNSQGPAFSFHPLRHLSAHLFNRTSSNGASTPTRPAPSRKAGSVLGLAIGSAAGSTPPPSHGKTGKPTVMDIHGMIAVGTEGGWVVVYNFSQDVRCILGNDMIASSSGPVTAVTISPDQTYVGVGHASGNIFLYDLAKSSKPARTQFALTLHQVMTGRKEGHLQGSRIVHIGFVGKRHTAIVTGDEDGRAFWFSLGRVMGVDSNDAVRMLGSYPERERSERPDSPTTTEGQTSAPSSVRSSHPAKKPTTLFASSPLPLGAASHATDEFQFAALLTPVKLVIVGMKPTPKTWFRKLRDVVGGGPYGGFVGCAAWLQAGEVNMGNGAAVQPSDPVLAYAWGTSLRFLRVRIIVTPPLDKKKDPIKTPEFVEGRRWDAPHPIQSLHWFDSDHVLLITAHEIILLDVRSMKPVENTPLQTKLLTFQDFYSGLSRRKGTVDAVPASIASSARTHRGKLFLLTKANVQVGTLQYWNDRVLASVHRGDFLSAINLALAYYEGRAPGNLINLPSDPAGRREVVGTRVRELMRASLDWAFSEDRMHDDTHFSADGRGVDLTSLFEGLATACIDACLAMDDMNFLFDDTYEHFANVGIQGIFLQCLEGYIFDGQISDVPPNVVQALIAMHDQQGEYALAEAVIWHIAPMSLDINQAVTLCEKRKLWDALIHVYTRAMGDYIAPIVKLIGVVCDVQRHRRMRPSLVGDGETDDEERLAPDAYKLYAYVANILTGLSYPSGETLQEPEATRARNDVYDLIFSDHNIYWPQGSYDVVLTDQDDDGMGEPPYPYLRLLLRFDTEAFLHAMDIAFEDSYLNDPSRAVNRQSIVNLMLDVMDQGFHSSDVTFLHIFVARNLPKYPQFIFIPPSISHRILCSLAADPDQSTREDRQLAAEYLLSAYTPHDADEMLTRFEQAGFFRILRAAYRRDRKWGALIGTLLKDPETDSTVFASLEEIVSSAKSSLHIVPTEVTRAITDALPQLMDISVRQTAHFIDRSLPTLHDTAITTLNGSDHKQAAYLRCLLDPSTDEAESENGEEPEAQMDVTPSTHLHHAARRTYLALLTRHDPSAIIPFLDARGPQFFELPMLAEQMEEAGIPEAQLWALDRSGRRKETFETVDAVLASKGSDLAEGLLKGSEGDVHVALATLTSVAHMAVRLCKEHSTEDTAIEDMWFGVLHSITGLVHQISGLSRLDVSIQPSALSTGSLEALRGLVQETLQALLATSSSSLSFARLFKRLVEAAPAGAKTTSAPISGGKKKKKGKKGSAEPAQATTPPTGSGARAYSEFRAILSGMLDSFRADSDVLALSIRVVDADLFELVEEKVAASQAGWRPSSALCSVCHKPLWNNGEKVVVRADGDACHARCQLVVEEKGEEAE